MKPETVTLNDKYAFTQGQAFMTGVQALVRLPLDQRRQDMKAGLHSAGFISGYRGSPLGGYDQQLSGAQAFLDDHHIIFHEGLNEDLAATSIWGSQQTTLFPGAKYDGVFGIWYGKAPGVDRAGDVFKHANFSGVSPTGGVLALLGDDPTCKSSTLPSQSEYAMMDYEIPVLNPATIQDVLDYGLYGIAMSRFAGCWAGLIALADTMDGGSVVNIDEDRLNIVIPEMPELDTARFIKRKDGRAEKEVVHRQQRLPAAVEFVRVNQLDKTVLGTDLPAKKRKIGIVTTGRASRDVFEAMDSIGLTEDRAEKLGLCIFKVAMTWPLEPTRISEFCKGLDTVLVVEHKRPLIEDQLKALLYDHTQLNPRTKAPKVYGKRQATGEVFPDTYVIPVPHIARALFDLMPKGSHAPQATAYFENIAESRRKAGLRETGNLRAPFFCSGCPHNTSTKLPEGSRALAGIGCHFLANMHDPNTDMHTQMGGEGAPWIGMAPFTEEKHVFANLGDGTYSHSGSLAIRAAVAANINITYKLLYNDAVAMTGGQLPELAGRSVPHIVTQLQAEAVSKIVVVADDLARYAGVSLPTGVDLEPRENLMQVQKTLRETSGVTVIVYDQTCATEKRRRRKRGLMEKAPARVFINKDVCENCGDCSVQSSCLSIEPTWTEMGLKRVINQSTCNQDMSCVKGFCPSFVTVYGTDDSQNQKREIPEFNSAAIPLPAPLTLFETYNIVITGIGGAGVTTISALLGMAAHIDGHAANTLDAVGLAQKGGAVTSHIRIARTPDDIRSGSVPPASADVIIGGDVIVSHDPGVMALYGHDRTRVVINTEIVPTMEYLGSRDLAYSKASMLKDIETAAHDTHRLNAQILSESLMGDAIYSNMIVLGMAWQLGYIPISMRALTRAVKLNGVKIDANIAAFEAGRLWAHDPDALKDRLPKDRSQRNPRIALLEDVITYRQAHLVNYQNTALAERYTKLVTRVQIAENALALSDGKQSDLTREVAIQYARLLAYKDEYEVARLYTDGRFNRHLHTQFPNTAKVRLNLAPPIFNRRDPETGYLKKREFGPLASHTLMTLFKGLTHLKGLRGTAFDIFGYTQERRMERRLISDFEMRVDTLLTGLTPETHGLAVRVIAAIDQIRGFGHVKERAVETAETEISALMEKWTGANKPTLDL